MKGGDGDEMVAVVLFSQDDGANLEVVTLEMLAWWWW